MRESLLGVVPGEAMAKESVKHNTCQKNTTRVKKVLTVSPSERYVTVLPTTKITVSVTCRSPRCQFSREEGHRMSLRHQKHDSHQGFDH